jgi:phage terminase large subunit-like protein
MTDRGWRVSKTKARQAGKIDVAVAAVMAHFGLLRNEPAPSVYEQRGLVLIGE